MQKIETRSLRRIGGVGKLGNHGGLEVFDAASRTARLMQGHDWSATPLGPVHDWPESLKSALRLMLASPSPMFIWWGPDLLDLHNDACAELFGRRRVDPRAIARPASEVRSEIWAALGREVVDVMRRNRAASQAERLLVVKRNGRSEESYFSFSLTPLRNEWGAAVGVLGACTEDTPGILSQRRLGTLRALAASPAGGESVQSAAATAARLLTANAHDVPFALIYMLEERGGAARLAAAAGAVPERVDAELAVDDAVWPLARARELRAMALTDTLPEAFTACTAGVWPEPAAGAAVFPLAPAGQGAAGFLILGSSPRLPMNDDYRGFLDIAATRVGAMLMEPIARERQRKAVEPAREERHNEFLAMLAHELRNPLAPIRSAAELLKYVEPSPVSLSHAREIIERQLSQLVRLMDDLLDVSRISRGKLELRKEPVDVRAAVATAVESAAPGIDEVGHRLTLKLPDGPLIVHGDRARLCQVVGNLLSNAVQYTRGCGHIELTVERKGDTAVVRVADDGIGIPKEMLLPIFDMFTQVEPTDTRPRKGLGIGLTIARRLVEMHGGTVTAASRGPGCGSEFTVRLPLQPELGTEVRKADAVDTAGDASLHGAGAASGVPAPRAETRRGKAQAVPSGPGAAAHGEGPPAARAPQRPTPDPATAARQRILVADDNNDAAAAIAEILATIGHDVRTAEDGLEAVELAESFRPHLILLDIGMPRLDGYEACRRIRQRAWGRDVAIYAVTGWGQASDRRRTREAGFNAHLVKPVAIGAIERLIAQREG